MKKRWITKKWSKGAGILLAASLLLTACGTDSQLKTAENETIATETSATEQQELSVDTEKKELSTEEGSYTVAQILSSDGTVTLKDGDGTELPFERDLSLTSGAVLSTGEDGVVEIALDQTKIIDLDKNSEIVIEKEGDALTVALNKGELFFDVKEKLAYNETFQINSGEMSLDIRGTAGLVKAEAGEEKPAEVWLLDGSVALRIGTWTSTRTIEPGQKVTLKITFDSDNHQIGPDAWRQFSYEELPQAVIDRIINDQALSQRVCASTNWNNEELVDWSERLASGDVEVLSWDDTKLYASASEGDETDAAETDATVTAEAPTGTGRTTTPSRTAAQEAAAQAAFNEQVQQIWQIILQEQQTREMTAAQQAAAEQAWLKEHGITNEPTAPAPASASGSTPASGDSSDSQSGSDSGSTPAPTPSPSPSPMPAPVPPVTNISMSWNGTTLTAGSATWTAAGGWSSQPVMVIPCGPVDGQWVCYFGLHVGGGTLAMNDNGQWQSFTGTADGVTLTVRFNGDVVSISGGSGSPYPASNP